MSDESRPEGEAPAASEKSDAKAPDAPATAPATPPSAPRANTWIVGAIVVTAGVFLVLNARRPWNRPAASPPGATAHAPPPGGGREVHPPLPSADPAVLAILDPLRVGSTAANAQITAISAVHDGRILVTLTRNGREARYGIMRFHRGAAGLPHSGNYVVYIHGQADPTFAGVETALTAALARHADAPVPAGLREIQLQ